MKPNYKNILHLYESAYRKHGAGGVTVQSREEPEWARPANRFIRESIAAKDLDIHSFSFEALLREAVGDGNFRLCKEQGGLLTGLLEAAGPVTTANFQQIAGQIIYGLVMDSYNAPEYKFQKLIPTRQSIYSFEKIAGVSEIGDEVSTVAEGAEYPVAGVTEDFRHSAETQKRGFKVQLTREVLFFDRTNLVQQRCAAGGKSMAINREKRAVNTIIDENGGAKSAALGGHRYHYRNNAIATYGDSSGNHDWDNLAASNGLVDWTDLDAAQQLLNGMTDPNTAEPIIFEAKHLVCAQQNELTALRIRNATEITVVTPGYATTGNPTETKVGNPFGNKFEVITSPYVAAQLATDTNWFYGDIVAAFEYVQNWPEEVKTLSSGTQLEFDRDIVQQYRFSEYGNYSTKEPRAMVRSTA